jgi:transaldolase
MTPARFRENEMDSLFNTKIFADGANVDSMLALYKNPMIAGFTTNPTLMRKAGITDYKAFAHQILAAIKDRPISFEVFADDFDEMELQAREIASWGNNIYVKIPITNTRGESAAPLIERLSRAGVKINVTAILTLQQVHTVIPALASSKAAYVSVFAGRIADTGIDPLPIMEKVVFLLKPYPQIELIWASPRELLNVVQASDIGCHIITATEDILKKLILVNKELSQYSLETVKMFYDDAQAAGYTIDVSAQRVVPPPAVLPTGVFG